MGADQFTVENGLAAQALQAATVSPIAVEPWTDGSALLYSATDGRLHPVPVQPAAGAIVSVTGIAPISVSPGVAPMVSLTGIVGEAHGGLGFDVSTVGTGLLKRTGPATYTTVADSLTVSAGAGLSGGGAVSLGGSTSLSLPNVGPGAGAVAFPASITLDAQGRVAAATAGSAPAALPLSRANGGLGSDVSALSTGLLAQTASNTWAVRSVAPGTGISVSNGDGVAGNPTVGLTNSSVTINTSGGVTGGGALALGSSLSLSLSAVPNAALANSSVTVNTSGGITGGGAVSLGSSLSLSLSAVPNSALANSSLTVSAGTGLSGGGAVSLGGSTSLSLPSIGSAGTYAYPSSMTTDAQGRVSSVTAGSAPTIGGSAVMLAQVSSNGGAGWIFSGDYFGLSQMTESGRGTPANVAPWVAPCAGTLKNFRTWTVAAAPSKSAFTVYQAATSSTPTYNATAAVLNIASGAHLGADTTHTLTIAAGDLIIFKTDTSWTNPGFCIQAQFIPSTA